jgi:hypothetical protein
MSQDESQSLDYLQQIRIIEAYSADDPSSINKLYFQEMVLESLSPEERDAYMRFLLEPRPRSLEEASRREKFGSGIPPWASWLRRLSQKLRGTTQPEAQH